MLDDAKTSRRLAETNDPQEIIAGLSRRTEAEISPAEKLADAKDVEVVIAGPAGLHARPATFFVDVANKFEAEIFVRANGKLANGKAMASLLSSVPPLARSCKFWPTVPMPMRRSPP